MVRFARSGGYWQDWQLEGGEDFSSQMGYAPSIAYEWYLIDWSLYLSPTQVRNKFAAQIKSYSHLWWFLIFSVRLPDRSTGLLRTYTVHKPTDRCTLYYFSLAVRTLGKERSSPPHTSLSKGSHLKESRFQDYQPCSMKLMFFRRGNPLYRQCMPFLLFSVLYSSLLRCVVCLLGIICHNKGDYGWFSFFFS